MSEAFRVNFTVWLSTIVIEPSRALFVSGSIKEFMRAAIELPSTLPSHHPVILRATSAAVKSSPLFHFTPLRTFNVYSVASSLTDQFSSRRGLKEPSLLYSTKYSSQPAVIIAICVQS